MLRCYQQFRGISKKSLALLIEQGIFSVDKDSLKLIYHREKDLFPDDGWEFGELIKLSEAGYIFYVNGELLVWEYPVSILSAFNEVWVELSAIRQTSILVVGFRSNYQI